MLLFKPYHVEPILKGIKTETRRIWKKQRVKKGSIHKAKIKMLSKEYFALLHIDNINTEHLFDITEEGAWKEGGYTRDEFLKIWDEINPKVLANLNPLVYVIRFHVLKENI